MSIRKSDGLKILNTVFSDKYSDEIIQPKKKVVGSFGIGNNKLYWVVSARKDRRHGVVGPVSIRDPYCDSLFKGAFAKWETN